MKIQKRKPTRCASGNRWNSHSAIKKHLIEDFDHRCAYCGDYDFYIGGSRFYHVEHFAPKSKFPELEYTYDNLLYACPFCNRFKSDKWISDFPNVNVIENKGFIDPCSDEYDEHLARFESGEIIAQTELGKYMCKELGLFLLRHKLLYKIDELNCLRKELELEIARLDEDNHKKNKLREAYCLVCQNFFQYYDYYEKEVV